MPNRHSQVIYLSESFGALLRRGWVFLSLALWTFPMGTLLSADFIRLDFPWKTKMLPSGLADFPRENSQGLESIEIPLLSLEAEGSVLVSVIFQDSEDRIIQARWVAGKDEKILAVNLSEGVRGWNQQAFKVPYELLKKPGALVIETDAEVQPVRRIDLTWMWPGGVYLASAAHTVEYIRDSNTVWTEKDLAEQSSAPMPDYLSNGIWRAALQETLEALDDGLQFDVPVKQPRAAVFRAKLLGYPLSASPSIRVNDQALSGISMAVPDLAAPGYFKGETGEIGFAGWREVAVVIPPGLLQAGTNSISLEKRNGAYIKDAQLELSFEDEGSPLDLFEENSVTPEEVFPSQAPSANILPDIDLPIEKLIERVSLE